MDPYLIHRFGTGHAFMDAVVRDQAEKRGVGFTYTDNYHNLVVQEPSLEDILMRILKESRNNDIKRNSQYHKKIKEAAG